jgi:hypothetical protein
MNAILRAAGATGLLWFVAGVALAAPVDADNYAEWSEPVALPSATAESSITRDSHVQLTSGAEERDDADDDDDDANHEGGAHRIFYYTNGPTWNVSVGAIYMHRSRPDPAAVITPPTGTPGVVVSGSDFGFDWGAGPDLSISQRINSSWLWEGRYFDNRESDSNFLIPNITTFRVAGIGVTILGGGSINSFYTTDLNSSELNVHRQLTPGCTFLTGFRWIELHDEMRNNLATPVTFTRWDENNHMYGAQIGTNVAFTNAYSPLQFTGSLKGGAYANVADNRFTSTIVAGANAQETELAFAGEVNFSGAYYLTNNLALRGGYQVLWLDNIALASEAAEGTTQIAGGTSSPVNFGRLWYNGVTFGIDYVW